MSSACLAAVTVLAACVLPAQQQRSAPPHETHARVVITPISVAARRTTLLVTLNVDPGWHVSWRNPGETGLPTRLAWNLPAGVRALAETWPVPVIAHTRVGATHTLEGDVPWLVEFETGTGAATIDRLISLTMRYGICRDVCIPEQITVQGVLPARMDGRVSIPAVLQRRLTTDDGVIAARRLTSGSLCLDRAPLTSGAALPELVADSGLGMDAAVPLRRRMAARSGAPALLVAVPDDAVLRDGSAVLFVRGDVGVTARLDFTRSSSRCTAR
jgi:Disulphide bond corrector protein DsbC